MKLPVLAALVALLLSALATTAQGPLPDDSRQSAPSSARRQRSAAQAKINTHLLDAIEQVRKPKSPPAPSESISNDVCELIGPTLNPSAGQPGATLPSRSMCCA